jgi:hypothetical protein
MITRKTIDLQLEQGLTPLEIAFYSLSFTRRILDFYMYSDKPCFVYTTQFVKIFLHFHFAIPVTRRTTSILI